MLKRLCFFTQNSGYAFPFPFASRLIINLMYCGNREAKRCRKCFLLVIWFVSSTCAYKKIQAPRMSKAGLWKVNKKDRQKETVLKGSVTGEGSRVDVHGHCMWQVGEIWFQKIPVILHSTLTLPLPRPRWHWLHLGGASYCRSVFRVNSLH